MKTINLLSILLFVQISFGQESKVIRKVVEIQKESAYYLTILDSRTYLSVDIPANTVEWYIAFTTTTDESTVNPINLFAQIASLFDPTGISSIAANVLTIPSGTSRCNVYVTDIENRDKFINLSSPSYFGDLSRFNITHGVIKASDKYKGNFQILLYNPSYTTNINITIEVTAIVEEQSIDMSVWSEESREELYNRIYLTTVITNGIRVAPDLTNCVVEKITTEKTPDDVVKMAQIEYDNYQSAKITECTQELSGGIKTEEQEKAVTYGNLAWESYENGNIDKCIELSKKALELDPDLGWVKANLGLCALIQNDQLSATEYYIDAINLLKKDKINGRKLIKACIDDIDNAQKKYPNLEGSQEISDLLKAEL